MPVDWQKFNNSFEVLYPPERTWVIGGKSFTQIELGWVEILRFTNSLASFIGVAVALNILDERDVLIASDITSVTFNYIFYNITDRSTHGYLHRLLGRERLMRLMIALRRPVPPICINIGLYAFMLSTDEYEHLEKYLTPVIAKAIANTFLEQNDLGGILEGIVSGDDDEEVKPSLGFYEHYLTLARHNLHIDKTWSMRKINMLYDVITRKEAAKAIEIQKKDIVDSLSKAGSSRQEIREAIYTLDAQRQGILYGREAKKDIVDAYDAGDY